MIEAGFDPNERWLVLTGPRSAFVALARWLHDAVDGDRLVCVPNGEHPDRPLTSLIAGAARRSESAATIDHAARASFADWLDEQLAYNDDAEIASEGWHSHFELSHLGGHIELPDGPATEILLAGR